MGAKLSLGPKQEHCSIEHTKLQIILHQIIKLSTPTLLFNIYLKNIIQIQILRDVKFFYA